MIARVLTIKIQKRLPGMLMLGLTGAVLFAASFPQIARTVPLSVPPSALEPVGIWSGNALLTVSGHSTREPVLYVQDESGQLIQQIALKIPAGEWTSVLNNRYARSVDGYVAVGGSIYGGNRGIGTLAIIQPNSADQIVVKTEPYVPVAVAFAADGNIWTAGIEKDENGDAKRPGADYFILRRFDRHGRALGGVLSTTRFSMPFTPVDGSTLVSSADRVGWFSPSAHRYIEFSRDGKQISEYMMYFDRPQIGGVALCEDNTLWMSVNESGLSVIKSLNRRTGALTERFSQKPFLYLYGSKGNALVTSSNWSEIRFIDIR